MPITQTRLLSLLEETERYQRAYRTLCNNLMTLCTSSMSDHDVRETLRSEILAAQELHPVHVLIERDRINRNGRRNDRMREKARLKRRAQGVPERDSPEYRANAARYTRDSFADREYDIAMGGRAITQDDLAPSANAGHTSSVASAMPQYDDTSPDPARWSAERLAQEATRGTIDADDIL